MLRSLLAHPATRGLDLDSPETTTRRVRILQDKAFLRRIYQEWYVALRATIPPPPGKVLELGSGAGFFKSVVPEVVTSDVMAVEGVDKVIDAHELPFADGELRSIVMTNVFHHLAHPHGFLTEASRCLRVGGVLAMIEPWSSPWSRLVYRLHHETFDPTAGWERPGERPLSDANGALAWIVFARDLHRFQKELPQWTLRAVRPMMPFRYVLSGGISMRSLMPGFTFPLWRAVERGLSPFMPALAMFAQVTLVRNPDKSDAG